MKTLGLILHFVLVSILVVSCSGGEQSSQDNSSNSIDIDSEEGIAAGGSQPTDGINSLEEDAGDTSENMEKTIDEPLDGSQESLDEAESEAAKEKSDWSETVEEVIETVVEVTEENKDLLEKKDIKIPDTPKLP